MVEPAPTRDHTERMLEAMGARVRRGHEPCKRVARRAPASRCAIDVPGDFSSAAPFIVAATLLPAPSSTSTASTSIRRRTGLLDVLERMGGAHRGLQPPAVGGEPVGDLEVRTRSSWPRRSSAREVPLLVDELPLFAAGRDARAATARCAGRAELRAKETDRIEAVVDGAARHRRPHPRDPDGFHVKGVPTRLRGGTVDSRGDHRIAMLGAVAGLASREGVEIVDAESVAVSFPGFFDLLDSLRAASTPA